MNQSTGNRPWLTNKKIFCIALLLLAAGYIAAQPMLEKWLGIELPNPLAQDEKQNENDGADNNNKLNKNRDDSDKNNPGLNVNDSEFKLETLAGGALKSPAGLVYQQTAREHRLDHVLRHASDIPDRDIHGVFDGDRDSILQTIDEAYSLIKSNSSQVTSNKEGRRTEYKINMKKRIGYVGGRAGQRKNHPECRLIQLVLQDNNVITAYPVDR